MAKKIIKLLASMAVMVVFWVLILGLLVSTEKPYDLFTGCMAALIIVICTWYTYMMIKPYVWEVCNKYNEIKTFERSFVNQKFDMNILNRFLNNK